MASPDRGAHSWTLDEEKSRPLIKQAVELGINFFDTANTYSDGTSEEFVGRALKELRAREEIVVATKFISNARGSERPELVTEGNHDGDRRESTSTGNDYVDLYQIHRWDKDHANRRNSRSVTRRDKAGKLATSVRRRCLPAILESSLQS